MRRASVLLSDGDPIVLRTPPYSDGFLFPPIIGLRYDEPSLKSVSSVFCDSAGARRCEEVVGMGRHRGEHREFEKVYNFLREMSR